MTLNDSVCTLINSQNISVPEKRIRNILLLINVFQNRSKHVDLHFPLHSEGINPTKETVLKGRLKPVSQLRADMTRVIDTLAWALF